MRISNIAESTRPAIRKLSEIGGQEIINIYDGGRLGIVADVDLLLDDKTGAIQSLLIPDNKKLFSLFSDKDFIEVPWSAVKKIGQDFLIVELNEKIGRRRI